MQKLTLRLLVVLASSSSVVLFLNGGGGSSLSTVMGRAWSYRPIRGSCPGGCQRVFKSMVGRNLI
jgi:hypothetical protein